MTGWRLTEPAGQPVRQRLLDLYQDTREKRPEEFILRGGAFDASAAEFLSRVNAALLDARREAGPQCDELGLLQTLLRDMDASMGTEPAGLVIRNAISIQAEIIASRESLPHAWRLAHHDRDIWRVFMDGDAWSSELGQYHFENELGYLAGCLRAFRYLMSTRGHNLDAPMLCRTHDVAVEGAFKRLPVPLVHRYQLGFRTQSVSFPLIPGRNCSAAGLAEHGQMPGLTEGWIEVTPPSAGRPGQLVAPARTAAQCLEKANSILSGFYAELGHAQSAGAPAVQDMQALVAIARCCQRLDQHHLFADANIRTIGFLCINKLLIEAGLAPAVLDYPKVLDMCSVDEIVLAIRQGQSRFEALRQGRHEWKT